MAIADVERCSCNCGCKLRLVYHDEVAVCNACRRGEHVKDR